MTPFTRVSNWHTLSHCVRAIDIGTNPTRSMWGPLEWWRRAGIPVCFHQIWIKHYREAWCALTVAPSRVHESAGNANCWGHWCWQQGVSLCRPQLCPVLREDPLCRHWDGLALPQSKCARLSLVWFVFPLLPSRARWPLLCSPYIICHLDGSDQGGKGVLKWTIWGLLSKIVLKAYKYILDYDDMNFG